MILVDTNVWVDHFRFGDRQLAALLEVGAVLIHPFVIGEMAVGNLRDRDLVLTNLGDLPRTAVATDEEVLRFINRYRLHGLGVGYFDVHLLAGARLTPGTSIWTRDNRLAGVADLLGILVDL